MKRFSTTQRKGYLLIEAMVAMGVLTTGVLGIFALMSQSIKLTRVIDDQYIGTYLAAEGVELAKNLLDANVLANPGNWNANGFAASDCYALDVYTVSLAGAVGIGCPDAGSVPLKFDGTVYRYNAGTVTSFTRSIRIEPILNGGPQEGVRVVSTVKWGGGASSVALEDKFYAWH